MRAPEPVLQSRGTALFGAKRIRWLLASLAGAPWTGRTWSWRWPPATPGPRLDAEPRTPDGFDGVGGPAGARVADVACGVGWAAVSIARGYPESEEPNLGEYADSIRTYFAAHQELQGIASPLRSLRQSCPQQVSPGDVARLYDAMAS